jgi:hypothetical protein
MLRPFNSSTGPANASHVAGSMVAPDRLLSGTLEFTTREGETSVVRPGDVLVAADDSGAVPNGG